jgi:hypothetical protein
VKYVTVNYVMQFSFKQLLNYLYGKIIQVKLTYAPIYIRATLYAKLTRGKCSKCKNFNVDLLHMRYVFYLSYDFWYILNVLNVFYDAIH